MTHPALDVTWTKSSFCRSGSCVEVAEFGDKIGVRNSAYPDGMIILVTREEWEIFLAGVRSGDFDVFDD